MSQPDPNYSEEWKACRDAMDRFDGILVDLRKYGFTILTGLTTAGSFLSASDNGLIQIGVIIVTMSLTVVLYYLDIYYQSLLYGSVFRARFLEIYRLNRGLTFYISAFYGASRAGGFLHFLYYGFLAALFVLGTVVLATTPATASVNNKCVDGPLPCLYFLFTYPVFWTLLVSAVTSYSFMVILVYRSDKNKIRVAKTISRLMERYRKYKDDPQRVDELEGYLTKYLQQYV
jgi:hypothetical protein